MYWKFIILMISSCCSLQCETKIKTTEPSFIKTKIVIAVDSLPIGIKKLLKAYPEHLKTATKKAIIWKDGMIMPYDDGQEHKTFLELLTNPDLEDQVMAMTYPNGEYFLQPLPQHDPGRIRYLPFFKKMYGNSKTEVAQQLRTIIWLPKSLHIPLQVTTVNQVDKKLQALSDKLDSLPHLLPYLRNPAGTFNWRKIAGTSRLSMHSFGMTIDINVEYANYWRWSVKGEDPNGKRIIEYRNRIPLELVKLFEQYGFIWGGKWYHYDTMHFEYRPELLVNLDH